MPYRQDLHGRITWTSRTNMATPIMEAHATTTKCANWLMVKVPETIITRVSSLNSFSFYVPCFNILWSLFTVLSPPEVIDPTSPPDHGMERPPWQEPDEETHQIIVHHSPTLEPFPKATTNKPQVIYENFDTKYNVYNAEPKPKDNEYEGGGGYRVTEAATPGTILVIGIIVGALIAVILIGTYLLKYIGNFTNVFRNVYLYLFSVIIVLKMRTRDEGAYKVDESRTYQFTPAPTVGVNPTATLTSNRPPITTPSVVDDTGFETPSIVGISNIPGTKATVTPAAKGFYDKYVVNNNQTNGTSGKKKPVREWYV